MTDQLHSILTRLGLGHFAALFDAQGIDDSLLAHLNEGDLEKIGVDKLGDRKRLLVAFSGTTPNPPPPAPHVVETPAPPVQTAPPALPPPSDSPLTATLERPYFNSLGLPFLPVQGCRALFCSCPVRVADYQIYCHETGVPMPVCDYHQEIDHPMVNVSWNDANNFCQWLTKREHRMGVLKELFVYKLPEDRDWSAAVGLLVEPGRTPAERSAVVRGYPWGREFPPPRGAGNYHARLGVDDFKETSPVCSFPPNRFGIYDLGGNVWEWCQDKYDLEGSRRVLRGASCFNDDVEYLLSSYRGKESPDLRRNNCGFRLTLSASLAKDSWY